MFFICFKSSCTSHLRYNMACTGSAKFTHYSRCGRLASDMQQALLKIAAFLTFYTIVSKMESRLSCFLLLHNCVSMTPHVRDKQEK